MLGRKLRVTAFGESHGCCVGVVLEGVPPGIRVDINELNEELKRRRPGQLYTSPRREEDTAEILSGVYKGYTTGAPLTIIVRNRDVDSRFYEDIVRWKPRPGHADLTARLRSLGFNDYRGGGFYSGRLTAAYVAAGFIAKKILETHGVSVAAYLKVLGGIVCRNVHEPIDVARVYSSPVRCPDEESSKEMMKLLDEAIRSRDSLGGIVEAHAYNVPPGLGDPPFNSLDGDIARALFSIPGVKGVEFGEGFRLAWMKGSMLDMRIEVTGEGRVTVIGPDGGVLGGHSTGDTIVVRAVFKPTSTIGFERKTIDWRGLEEAKIVGYGRHDPAIAIRAVPVVEAMLALVIADHLLDWLSWRLEHYYRLERGLT